MFLKTLQDEDDLELYHSLPYEIARAVVRSLCLHTSCYLKAKDELRKQEEVDPEFKKAKSIKVRDEVKKLSNCDRFIVMNRRTAWVATPEWVTKHMTVGADGRPVPKKKDAKCNPWILTLRVAISSSQVELLLKANEKKKFRVVKCFDLDKGRYKATLTTITSGYEHLFDEGGKDSNLFCCKRGLSLQH